MFGGQKIKKQRLFLQVLAFAAFFGALVFTNTVNAASDCAGLGDAYTNDATSGHCYFRENSTVNWTTAKANCEAAGGYLAIISSERENDLVQALVFGVNWIGATDADTEGVWKWLDNDLEGATFWSGAAAGSPVNGAYTDWDPIEPNDFFGEDCGATSSSLWGDRNCSTENLGYICELSPCQSPAGTTGDREYVYGDNTYKLCNGASWTDFSCDASDGITNGLVAHWKFDESSGTNADDYVGANDGTLLSTAAFTTSDTKIGNAIDFDGATTNTLVYMTDSGTTLDAKTNFSVSFWTKLDTLAANPHNETLAIKGHGSSPFASWSFTNLWASGILTFNVLNTSGSVYSAYTNSAVSTGVWYHVVGVKNGTDIKIYVNGTDTDTTGATFSGTLVDGDSNLAIGGSGIADKQMDGRVDDFRIYDRALTQDEITGLYNLGNTGCTTLGSCAAEAVMEYDDTDEHAYHYCDGTNKVKLGNEILTGCANEGEIEYDSAGILKFCNSSNYVCMAKGPCGCNPSPGDVCSDGTVYAGLTPDGNLPMYTTRCDQGRTWNGATCTGTKSQIYWNDGNTNHSITGITSTTDGDGNTAALILADSDAVTGGVQEHLAAKECADLSYGGHTDWYLPAKDELDVVNDNMDAIGGFYFSVWQNDFYHTSTEVDEDQAWNQDFFTAGGPQDDESWKHGDISVRCVRHD